MWTVENCARYDRSRLRYPSDLTDEEWTLVRPQIPRAKRGGNKRSVDERAVMNGLICAGHLLPVARHPERSAAAQHSESLLRSLAG